MGLKKIEHYKDMSVENKLSKVKKNKETVIEEVKNNSNIKNEDISEDLDFDYDFLKNSLEDWDKIDVGFVVLLVSINLLWMKESNIDKKGKEIQENHSYNANKQDKKRYGKNKIHNNMPNDKIPEGHMGLKNPNGGRAGGSAKITDVNLNHRQIYGHDLFKLFKEFFKDLDKIKNVQPIFGYKKLGGIVKQIFHMWYDLYSETRLHLPERKMG